MELLLQKDVTEDIWFEIFLRLPQKPIFKFKCVSKVWLSILSNPCFINKWNKLNCASLLPWTFVHPVGSMKDHSSKDNQLRIRRNFTIAYPKLYSQFISHHQSGFSFSFLNNHVPDKIYLIGSSNGLVLCTTTLFNQVTYYVCNPLTQKWVLLPPPPPSGFDLVVTGFICNDGFSSGSYKVIRIPKFEAASKEFKVEIFSSDIAEWNICEVSCPQDITWEYSPYNNVVTHNGVLYWFQKERSRIIAFSLNTTTKGDAYRNECRWIGLPDPEIGGDYMSQCLGESEGLICYTRIKDTRKSLSVWVLQEDWYLLRKDVKFHDTLAEIVGEASTADLIAEVQVLGFSPVDKNVVILGYKKHILAFNTSTRGYEQLCHPSSLGSNLQSVPHLSVLAFALQPRPTILPPIYWRE